jgi:hypothetical protein
MKTLPSSANCFASACAAQVVMSPLREAIARSPVLSRRNHPVP